MTIYISNRIYKKLKDVPHNKIEEKILKFAHEISEASSNFTSLPKGFWSRRIISCPNRYKFRVNRNDRIIFEYSEDKKDIYFLDYCSHDQQIRSAKEIQNIITNLEIDTTPWIGADTLNDKIDKSILKEAEEFVDLGDLQSALEKFKSIGHKHKEKQIRFAISLNESKKDFNELNKQRSSLFIHSDKIDIRRKDILYVLNRIYSEKQFIIGRYFVVKHGSIEMAFYLEKEFKKNSDYLSAIVDKIINELGSFKFFVEIECCFYKNNELASKPLYIDYELDTFLFKESNSPYTKNKHIENFKNIYNEVNSHVLSKKALAEINLPAICGIF